MKMKMMFTSKLPLLLVLMVSSSLLTIHGEMMCDDLPKEYCAFAIASSGKRCVLEQNYNYNNNVKKEYQCRTSDVVVVGMSHHIESDGCVKSCGVDRMTVGISSDALLESSFVDNLCSSACQQNCPNIVDLYSNLVAGEGGSLKGLCERQRSNPRRALSVLKSSGVSGVDESAAPAPSPSSF